MTENHPAVQHPRDIVAGAGNPLKRFSDWAAFKVAAIYGSAIAIWAFALYSGLGAIVSNGTQDHMLYWSNGVQLVFCAVMTYVGNQLSKGQSAKADADHAAQTHIASTVDQILAAVVTNVEDKVIGS